MSGSESEVAEDVYFRCESSLLIWPGDSKDSFLPRDL
jgi:hypothetical protein